MMQHRDRLEDDPSATLSANRVKMGFLSAVQLQSTALPDNIKCPDKRANAKTTRMKQQQQYDTQHLPVQRNLSPEEGYSS
jgi:hypothetical protein